MGSILRVILHVDLDYFFAQIEENLNSSLKTKPLVVCVYSGRTEDSGAVSTSNYLARKFGVKSGIPIYLAKKLLKGKDAIFIPVNHELYENVSKRIMSLLKNFADKFEQVSIDEAFLDVTKKTNNNFKRAYSFAKSIKNEVLKKEGLTCSVGIGANKLIAKIASAQKKPDGLTLVTASEAVQFLSNLPVERLPGVGKKSKKILENERVRTIGDLASYDKNKLKMIFGNKTGEYFHKSSMGIDEEPVKEEEPKQFSRIVTLKEDTIDFQFIGPILRNLSKELWSTVNNQNYIFRSIGIIVIIENLKSYLRTKTLYHATNNPEIIYETASELLLDLIKRIAEHKIRRIGVKVYNLERNIDQKSLNGFF